MMETALSVRRADTMADLCWQWEVRVYDNSAWGMERSLRRALRAACKAERQLLKLVTDV